MNKNSIIRIVAKRILPLAMAMIFVFNIGAVSVEAKKVKGTYPIRRGEILVTSDWIYRLIPTGHAAIVWDRDHVVEAQSQGIIVGKNDWMSNRREVYGVEVKSTTTNQDRKAAEWCYQQLGKPYNFNYLNKKTRDSFYCSQLVWASFYDLYGIDLSNVGWRPGTWTTAVHPMELVTSKKTRTTFYYKK